MSQGARNDLKQPYLCTTEEFRTWVDQSGMSLREVSAFFGGSKSVAWHWYHGRSPVPKNVARYLARCGTIPKRNRPDSKPKNHDPLCPPGQGCRSCGVRRARQQKHWNTNKWPDEAVALLHRMAPDHSEEEIAVALTQVMQRPITINAIRWQARQQNILVMVPYYTIEMISQILGVASTHAITGWVEQGLLESLPRPRRGYCRILPKNLEAFFRRYHAFFDHKEMPFFQGQFGAWRALVWQLNVREPMWTIAQVAAFIGHTTSPVKTALHCGELPGVLLTHSWRIPRAAAIRWAQQREARSA